ncbi:MAG: hypothetical protein ACLQLO_02075 [Mycobacterium sp.]
MKILVGAAIAVCVCVGAPAPAGAEPNPFSALSCSGQPTPSAGSAGDEIDRGLRDGLRASPQGLSAA